MRTLRSTNILSCSLISLVLGCSGGESDSFVELSSTQDEPTGLSAASDVSAASVGWTEPIATDALTVTKITEAHKNDAYDALAWGAGRLWIGKSRQTDGESHRAEAYRLSGKGPTDFVLEGTTALSHTPSHFYGAADDILAVGKSYTDQWRTHHTRIDSQRRARTTTLPIRYQVDQSSGPGSVLFFSEPGEARVVRADAWGARLFGPTVSGPGALAVSGNFLWVVERRNFQLGDENLVRISIASQTAARTFTTEPGQGVTDLLPFAELDALVVNERLASRLLIVGMAKNEITAKVPLSAAPMALARFGSCVAAATQDKRIAFVDLRDTAAGVIESWDLSGLGDTYYEPRRMVALPSEFAIAVRSGNVCPTCVASRNTVFTVAYPESKALGQCTGSATAD